MLSKTKERNKEEEGRRSAGVKNPVNSGKAEVAKELRLDGDRECFPKTRHFAYVSRDAEGSPAWKSEERGKCRTLLMYLYHISLDNL